MVRRMSPTQGTSGLEREKRRVRVEVGSRRESWEAVHSWMGEGNLEAVEGGGG